MSTKLVRIEGCDFIYLSDTPYSIIMCLIGREDDLVSAEGYISMVFDHVKSVDMNNVAKRMFTNDVSLKDIRYACDKCREKGITSIAYFFGILNNLENYNDNSPFVHLKRSSKKRKSQRTEG